MTPRIRSGELFAGVGGLGLAVSEVFGAEPAWFAEFDEAPSKVLAHHYPGVPNHGDVTRIDFRALPHTHVRCGGFPCQDVSLAGRRRGMVDGTRSGLWSEFLRSIEEDRPEWVVIENVRGLLSADGEPWHDDLIDAHEEMRRWMRVHDLIVHRMEKWSHDKAYIVRKRGELVRVARHRKRAVARFKHERRLVQRAIAIVLRGLADRGFDAEWTGLRAADVGAPHGRFRVFILAWPRERTVADAGHGTGHGERPREEPGEGGPTAHLTLLPTPAVVMNDGESVESWTARRDRIKAMGINGNGMGMPLPIAVQLLPTPTASEGDHGGPARTYGNGSPTLGGIGALLPTPDAYSGDRGGSQHPDKRRGAGHTVSLADVTEHALMPTPQVADATGGHASRSGARSGEKLLPGVAVDAVADWGPYTAAIRRWEQVIGRPAPAPVRFDGKGGKARLNPELPEFMMGWDEGWVTDPAIGLSRAEQLKAIGNGVVTLQAVWALRELLARPGVPAVRG